MRSTPEPATYEEPFCWWGPVWAPPDERSLSDLIADGTIAPEAAAVCATALERRAAIAVVAGPGGIGKSTLLHALLESYPPQTRRIYLRGCYENFGFLRDREVIPNQTLLLANEVSPHLPTYLWGPGVERFLSARVQGFTLAATAHAQSPEGFVRLLSNVPLRLSLERVAAFDLVLVLTPVRGQSGALDRRVTSVATFTPTERGGLQVTALYTAGSSNSLPELNLEALGELLDRLDPAAEPQTTATRQQEFWRRRDAFSGDLRQPLDLEEGQTSVPVQVAPEHS